MIYPAPSGTAAPPLPVFAGLFVWSCAVVGDSAVQMVRMESSGATTRCTEWESIIYFHKIRSFHFNLLAALGEFSGALTIERGVSFGQ
jgi:hypothetical protein